MSIEQTLEKILSKLSSIDNEINDIKEVIVDLDKRMTKVEEDVKKLP